MFTQRQSNFLKQSCFILGLLVRDTIKDKRSATNICQKS